MSEFVQLEFDFSPDLPQPAQPECFWFPLTYPCPNCDGVQYTEHVDVGVGFRQVAPAYCPECGHVGAGCPAEECSTQCISYEYCRGVSLEGGGIPTILYHQEPQQNQGDS